MSLILIPIAVPFLFLTVDNLGWYLHYQQEQKQHEIRCSSNPADCWALGLHSIRATGYLHSMVWYLLISLALIVPASIFLAKNIQDLKAIE